MKKLGCFGFLLAVAIVILSILYWDIAKGFYYGWFHGLVAPFTLFLQLIFGKVNFYYNSFSGISGWLFDLGFFIGITSGGVGGTKAVNRKRN
ncbi:hypothetical protein [Haloplasma contractile]|uniref:Uncharacterized protein n=1 Tax=Haloplasma contractile SSD-17B TaxID=1033810 RepID=U2DT08_9MOLU|nr:hypothetical protein [Haloplasma contractile]ERJ11627.1 hypothetical protein HLPCO_002328 [Haloplasma contractile SSD-17B]